MFRERLSLALIGSVFWWMAEPLTDKVIEHALQTVTAVILR